MNEVMTGAAPERSITVIEAHRGWRTPQLGQLWRYRELLAFFALRDIKVKYKQTAFGVLWTVFQPVVMMLVFSLVFGHMVGLENSTGDIPYPLYLVVGLVPWNFFSTTVTSSSNSILAEGHIITKIFFPRLLIPLATVGTTFVDFLFAFIIIIFSMAYYGIVPPWQVVFLPLFTLLLIFTALSIGIFVAALGVAYRDFRYIMPFFIMVLQYVSPVLYPSTLIPERFRWLMRLNPVGVVIDGFRHCCFGTPLNWNYVCLSFLIVTLALYVSMMYFRKMEAQFADII